MMRRRSRMPLLLVATLLSERSPVAAQVPFQVLHSFAAPTSPVRPTWLLPTPEGPLVDSFGGPTFRLVPGPRPTFLALPGRGFIAPPVPASDGSYFGFELNSAGGTRIVQLSRSGIVVPVDPQWFSDSPRLLKGRNQYGGVYAWGRDASRTQNLLVAISPSREVQPIVQFPQFAELVGIGEDNTVYGIRRNIGAFTVSLFTWSDVDGFVDRFVIDERDRTLHFALEANGVVAVLDHDGVSGDCRLFRSAQGQARFVAVVDSPCDRSATRLLVPGTDGFLYGLSGNKAFRVSPTDVVTIVRDFRSTVDGPSVQVLAQAHDGVLWGLTNRGGEFDGGSIFAMTSAGTLLRTVDLPVGPPEGYSPAGPLLPAGHGVFFQTMREGGAYGKGVVVRTTTTGETRVVYTFTNRGDGAFPTGLVRGPDGAMYGATFTTVFRVAPSGALTTLFVFRRPEDGEFILAPLTAGPGGFLYGTTTQGGRSGLGTAFRIATDGTVTVLHHFEPRANEAVRGPVGPLVLGRNGLFYGIRRSLTSVIHSCSFPCGALFSMTPTGAVTILREFEPEDDPGELAFETADGWLYGRTRRQRMLVVNADRQVVSLSARGGTLTGLGRTSVGQPLWAEHWYEDDAFTRPVVGFFTLRPSGSIGLLHRFEPRSGLESYGPLSFTDGGDGWIYGVSAGGAHDNGYTFRIAVDAPAPPTGVRIGR